MVKMDAGGACFVIVLLEVSACACVEEYDSTSYSYLWL